MSTTAQTAALEHRAASLEAGGFNGLRFGLVTLQPAGPAPTSARLELFFLSKVHVADFLALGPAGFPVTGGRRLPAGQGLGQVQVTNVAAGSAPDRLLLTLAPIGDYSTYHLSVLHAAMDPLFASLEFKFRPGCFSTDCNPDWEAAPPPQPAPAIDYLAKDYESFRHTLHVAMAARVPGWQPSSEADLDETLIDLIAAAGDELSDYQDRVMNEAYLFSCRNRVSLARHARLMDYHIHQGCQASTWLALEVDPAEALAQRVGANELQVRTGSRSKPTASDVIFSTRETHLHPDHRSTFLASLNALRLYTWQDTRPSLRAGAMTADILAAGTLQAHALQLVDDLLGTAAAPRTNPLLLLQEHLNPATGAAAGRAWEKRQLLHLTSATAMEDPVDGVWFVRVTWAEEDALQRDYCFTVFCPGQRVENCSLFHGNIVRVHHGATVTAHFREPGTDWPGPGNFGDFYSFYERTPRYGTLCRLPVGPLAYLDTPEGGVIPPMSSLRRLAVPPPNEPPPGDFEAHVDVEAGGKSDLWDEVISLVHSDQSPENGDHFCVETDELGRSVLRFGPVQGANGLALPANAVIHCRYQIGGGRDGNVGADSLTNPFETDPAKRPAWLRSCWNPFDVFNGRDPEPVERIIRNAPEAFRARQLRAITLEDYRDRAEQVAGVSRALARYAWTGSWRTVRITLDPKAGTSWDDLFPRVARQLEAVRLIGEDLEIRPPRLVPLQIVVRVCLKDEFWATDVRAELEQEFSTGWTHDGRRGFFHPDLWTFGQSLHRSEIEGRILRVPGVEHVISIRMKRFNDRQSPLQNVDELKPRFDEIFQVHNDPDSMEDGSIEFQLSGGRI